MAGLAMQTRGSRAAATARAASPGVPKRRCRSEPPRSPHSPWGRGAQPPEPVPSVLQPRTQTGWQWQPWGSRKKPAEPAVLATARPRFAGPVEPGAYGAVPAPARLRVGAGKRLNSRACGGTFRPPSQPRWQLLTLGPIWSWQLPGVGATDVAAAAAAREAGEKVPGDCPSRCPMSASHRLPGQAEAPGGLFPSCPGRAAGTPPRWAECAPGSHSRGPLVPSSSPQQRCPGCPGGVSEAPRGDAQQDTGDPGLDQTPCPSGTLGMVLGGGQGG